MKEHDVKCLKLYKGEHTSQQRIVSIICAILTVLAFRIKLDLTIEEQLTIGKAFVEFTKSFQSYDITVILLVLVLSYFYRYVSGLNGTKRCNLFLACIFSAFMVLGESYDKTDSWNLVFNTINFQWLKVIIRFSGYAVFFFYCINLIFYKADNIHLNSFEFPKKNKVLIWYIKCLGKKPFITAFMTLFICYIPYMVVSYPGIAGYDMHIQIMQSYPEAGIYAPAYTQELFLKEGVYLNNHHPIVHTLLLHLFFEIGNIFFGSYNCGLFLFAMAQMIVLFLAIAIVVALMIEINVPVSKVCLVLLYYIISPRMQSYMFLVTKDVLFSAFSLMFLVVLFYMNQKCEKKHYVLFGISVLGVFWFRNDGKYLLILSFVIIAILVKNLRRVMLWSVLCLTLFSFFWSNILLPVCGVIPGSVREVLSIPFQQTARYVRDSSTPLTKDEEDAISAVLDYDIIADRYDPEVSDNVKSTYKNGASKEDLIRYFIVYVKMFFKHPSHYIQATFNNYYYYFYPGPRLSDYYGYHYSSSNFDKLNDKMKDFNINIYYPETFNDWRDIYEKLREGIARLPVVSVFVSAASYNWVLILLFFYCVQRGKKKGLALLVPLCIQLLISLAGPTNGWYFRYTYPIAVCLPATLFLCLRLPEECRIPQEN